MVGRGDGGGGGEEEGERKKRGDNFHNMLSKHHKSIKAATGAGWHQGLSGDVQLVVSNNPAFTNPLSPPTRPRWAWGNSCPQGVRY